MKRYRINIYVNNTFNNKEMQKRNQLNSSVDKRDKNITEHFFLHNSYN